MLYTALTLLLASPFTAAQERLNHQQNKTFPSIIKTPVLAALSHYPELKETTIHFVFTDKLEKSIMAARPTVGSLFRKRKRRVYNVLINPAFKLGYNLDSINRIPDSVMIGWLGHELGHIMDYEQKSTWEIIGMGISYTFSRNYIRKAECVADTHAVGRGMADYLVTKKSFILNHTELPQAYRDKIEALYLSPEDVDKLVADLASEDTYEQDALRTDDEEAVYENQGETHSEKMHEESIPGIS